ncbi:MAG: hypothetical protein AB1756_09640, partial [Acidobacteriota bacterium]
MASLFACHTHIRPIGIGGASRLPSSHTTWHTDHVYGGSNDYINILCTAEVNPVSQRIQRAAQSSAQDS